MLLRCPSRAEDRSRGAHPIAGADATRQVFISYASPDQAAANTIREVLETRGLACWIAPRDIEPGLDWADAIILGINDAQLLLLVHSAAVSASPMVRREVNAALARKLPVMTIRIDDALPRGGMEFYLGTAHWFDATAGDLSNIAEAARGLLAKPTSGLAVPESTFVDRPAIAVLPFRAQPEDTFLAEALTDDLIAAVSSWRLYPVISRTSVFAVSAESRDARLLGRLLGARYIVNCSLRQGLGRLRVTVELVDVTTGANLLAETIDRPNGDPTRTLDDVIVALATILGPELTKHENARAAV